MKAEQKRSHKPSQARVPLSGHLRGAPERYTAGAYPELLPPREAIQAYSIPAAEVAQILTSAGYLKDGRPTQKLDKAQVRAICNKKPLWNLDSLLKVLRRASKQGDSIQKVPVNQNLPENLKPGVFATIEQLAPYFGVEPFVLKGKLIRGGWWRKKNKSAPKNSRDYHYGAPSTWVIKKGYARRQEIEIAEGVKATIWLLDAWHVMSTFAGLVGSPIPKHAVIPLDMHPVVAPPDEATYAAKVKPALLKAAKKSDYKEMHRIVAHAWRLGPMYAGALEKACGLPIGTFQDEKWANKLTMSQRKKFACR